MTTRQLFDSAWTEGYCPFRSLLRSSLLKRGEPSADRVFDYVSGNHEVQEIIGTSGLGTKPRHLKSAERMASHDGAGAPPVYIEVSGPEIFTCLDDICRGFWKTCRRSARIRVAFATRSASSKSFTFITASNGPKISSWASRLSGVDSAKMDKRDEIAGSCAILRSNRGYPAFFRFRYTLAAFFARPLLMTAPMKFCGNSTGPMFRLPAAASRAFHKAVVVFFSSTISREHAEHFCPWYPKADCRHGPSPHRDPHPNLR